MNLVVRPYHITINCSKHLITAFRKYYIIFSVKNQLSFSAQTNGLIPFARSATSLMRSITSFAEGNIIYANGVTSFICAAWGGNDVLALLEMMLRVPRK